MLHEREVTIEIPAWSFRKAFLDEGVLCTEFRSLVPCPFNYGFVVGTTAADGRPQDVIVLGAPLPIGAVVPVCPRLVVGFDDAGVVDDKWVACKRGERPSGLDLALLGGFFLAYTWLKRCRLIAAGRAAEALATRWRGCVRWHVPKT